MFTQDLPNQRVSSAAPTDVPGSITVDPRPLRDVNRPRPSFSVENLVIRKRRWYRFCPHEELNGAKIVPVRIHGAGNCMYAPVPAPDPILMAHFLSRFINYSKVEILNLYFLVSNVNLCRRDLFLYH
jgi:hypothetical protein